VSSPVLFLVRSQMLLRLACSFFIALMLATGPLWFGGNSFPVIPLVGGLSADPAVQRIASQVVIVCLAAIILFAQRNHVRTGCAFLVMLLLGALVLLNQHRLQAWLVELLIVIGILAFSPQLPNSLRTIRLVTIGIYFHSAVSKFDYDFLSGGGFYLVKAMTDQLHLPADGWPAWARVSATTVLPLFEMSVAVLLISRRFRLYGWLMAILMHAVLLAALFGLYHKPGVLIWNAWFIAQAIFFLSISDSTPKTSGAKVLPTGARLVSVIAIVTACVMPFFNYEPIHLWDNWPSWSLYSSRSERVGVFIHEDAIASLPKPMQQFVGRPAPFLCRVKVDRWSLEATGAPVYPEDRFGVGVALQLAKQTDDDRTDSHGSVFVRIDSVANRFSGERDSLELNGRRQLQSFADSFLLNASPAPDTSGLLEVGRLEAGRSSPVEFDGHLP
jgi:hypothetical protein